MLNGTEAGNNPAPNDLAPMTLPANRAHAIGGGHVARTLPSRAPGIQRARTEHRGSIADSPTRALLGPNPLSQALE